MESLPQNSQEVSRSARRNGLPMDIGELGIRVSIPGHPEIVAYKLRGAPSRDRTVDDLIELDRLIKAEEVTNEN